MNYSFWWSSASDEMLLINLLLMASSLQKHFVFRSTLTSGAVLFRRSKLPFCWFLCSLLFFQNLIMISNFFLWSCTLEQILAYPIDNFLIPCYNQNSEEVVLNTFFSNRLQSTRRHWLHWNICSSCKIGSNQVTSILCR